MLLQLRVSGMLMLGKRNCDCSTLTSPPRQRSLALLTIGSALARNEAPNVVTMRAERRENGEGAKHCGATPLDRANRSAVSLAANSGLPLESSTLFV